MHILCTYYMKRQLHDLQSSRAFLIMFLRRYTWLCVFFNQQQLSSTSNLLWADSKQFFFDYCRHNVDNLLSYKCFASWDYLLPITICFCSYLCRMFWIWSNRVVFVGGKPRNFPVTGSDLPPHWFVWKLPCQGKSDSSSLLKFCWTVSVISRLLTIVQRCKIYSVYFSQIGYLSK